MRFTVKDKSYNNALKNFWYRIDVIDDEILQWVSQQPIRRWYHVENSSYYGHSYVIDEELYTLLQLRWGDQ